MTLKRSNNNTQTIKRLQFFKTTTLNSLINVETLIKGQGGKNILIGKKACQGC